MCLIVINFILSIIVVLCIQCALYVFSVSSHFKFLCILWALYLLCALLVYVYDCMFVYFCASVWLCVSVFFRLLCVKL